MYVPTRKKYRLLKSPWPIRPSAVNIAEKSVEFDKFYQFNRVFRAYGNTVTTPHAHGKNLYHTGLFVHHLDGAGGASVFAKAAALALFLVDRDLAQYHVLAQLEKALDPFPVRSGQKFGHDTPLNKGP